MLSFRSVLCTPTYPSRSLLRFLTLNQRSGPFSSHEGDWDVFFVRRRLERQLKVKPTGPGAGTFSQRAKLPPSGQRDTSFRHSRRRNRPLVQTKVLPDYTNNALNADLDASRKILFSSLSRGRKTALCPATLSYCAVRKPPFVESQ